MLKPLKNGIAGAALPEVVTGLYFIFHLGMIIHSEGDAILLTHLGLRAHTLLMGDHQQHSPTTA